MTAPTNTTRPSPPDHLRGYALAAELASSPHALPIPAYLAAHHPAVTNPMGSAAVFHHHPPSRSHGSEGGDTKKGSQPRLLLVRRAPGDFLPLRWELPGGSAEVGGGEGGGEGEGEGEGEGGDGSVVDTAVRELWEETGLVAAEAVRHVGAREFGEDVGAGAARLLWRADVFEVAVRPGDEGQARDGRAGEGQDPEGFPAVRLDPAEHVAHVWAGEDEVAAGWCGGVELVLTDPGWRALLLRAFELHRRGCGC